MLGLPRVPPSMSAPPVVMIADATPARRATWHPSGACVRLGYAGQNVVVRGSRPPLPSPMCACPLGERSTASRAAAGASTFYSSGYASVPGNVAHRSHQGNVARHERLVRNGGRDSYVASGSEYRSITRLSSSDCRFAHGGCSVAVVCTDSSSTMGGDGKDEDVAMEWTAHQSIHAANEGEEHKFTGKVQLLDPGAVTGITSALSLLNSGAISCQSGFCAVYSRSLRAYYVLYSRCKRLEAYSALGKECSFAPDFRCHVSAQSSESKVAASMGDINETNDSGASQVSGESFASTRRQDGVGSSSASCPAGSSSNPNAFWQMTSDGQSMPLSIPPKLTSVHSRVCNTRSDARAACDCLSGGSTGVSTLGATPPSTSSSQRSLHSNESTSTLPPSTARPISPLSRTLSPKHIFERGRDSQEAGRTFPRAQQDRTHCDVHPCSYVVADVPAPMQAETFVSEAEVTGSRELR
eukprot:TRINITY_DN5257_c0_g2_i1.p1 TRINITY_DN5257_c0_g2~~TRINITY_DN5257_c0_g2_i1.p1  ORF type:complete len:468 (+),score=30.79 TRINITY_DN5257_c0_g2_i1:86-1489(+)